MATRPPQWAENPKVVKEIQGLASQLQCPAMAARLWQELLSPRDHRRLGALEKWYPKPGTIGIWRLRDKGELIWRGEVICRVRPMKKQSNLESILAKFQSRLWPICIDNPDPVGMDQDDVYQTLRHLNDKLTKNTIRFHSKNGGTRISWSISKSQ